MRRLLPLVLAISLGGSAWSEDTTQPPDVQGITATISGDRVNVRFGPSANAKPIVTLHAGDPVEILGSAEVPDWYVIRFPKTGQAWVDGKNLQAIDGGKRWKVMTDGTRARDDATLKGSIVAELAKDEIIEDRNSSRGNWHAVYIPSAVAYVSKKYVTVPNAEAIDEQKRQRQKADVLWQAAQDAYAKLYRQLHEQPETALDVDWAPLIAQLDEVAKTHPDASVRLNAQRIHDGVATVAEKSRALREARGDKPPTRVASATTGGSTTGGTFVKVPEEQGPLKTPETGTDTQPVKPAQPQALPTPQAPAGGYTAVGFVSENSDYPKVGAPNLLLDGNSKVVAFLTVKGGASVNLAEYYWRWVGVSGQQKDLDPALHGLGTKIPLIEVDAVQLVKK